MQTGNRRTIKDGMLRLQKEKEKNKDIVISFCFTSALNYTFLFLANRRVAAYSEWMILYILCKDKQGLLHKETIKAVYDGSLFEQMAKEKACKKQP